MPPLKPCHHCLSDNIALSRRLRSDNYHVSFYCKQCYAYGPRVLSPYGSNPSDCQKDIERAAELWNTRMEQTTLMED